MMKKIITMSVLSAITIVPSLSYAAEDTSGFYVSGRIGTSIVSTHDAKSTYVDNGSTLLETKTANKNRGVFGGGFAAGYDFYDQYKLPIRFEVDMTFRGKGSSDGSVAYDIDGKQGVSNINNDVRMNTYMLNGYYDFHNESAFTPYVSASIGLANLKLENKTYEGDDSDQISNSANNFAWGLGAGLKYDINTNLAVDFSYKYINAGKVDASRTDEGFSYTSKLKSYSNDIMMGVIYKF
ncbi:porin family protein [Morganella morganii]|nr:porin family protein [Morganella morganii]